jgi:PAS domain S-box-containing protein
MHPDTIIIVTMKKSRKRETARPKKVLRFKPKIKSSPDESSGKRIYEKALSAIVESSHEAILSKTLDGTILTWNKGAERLYGYTPEDVIGKPVTMLAAEHRVSEIPGIMEKIKQGIPIERYETVRKKKDGTLFDISLSVSPIIDDTGKIIGASAVAHDITHEKRLREIRYFLASIVDSSEDAIFSKDLNGIVLSWNRGAEKLYGYTAEEAIGTHVSLLTPSDRKHEVDRIIDILKNGERIEHYETVRVTKYGQEIHISLRASPVLDANGELMAISVIARDITTRKKAEEERSRLLAELAQSLQEKNVLLQEVYHRVKNNLQVIGSMLELRSHNINDDPKKATSAFADSIARIRAMALIHESLLQTEKLDKLDFLVYLRTLSNQLLNSYSFNKSVHINISGDPQFYGLDISVSLGLIFNELITNSLKYAFPDTNEGIVEVEFRRENRNTIIRISDNGIGLPADFDFAQTQGFGFRIVKLLTKQLNATIKPIQQEKGTAFEVKIFPRTEKPDAF